MSTSEVHDDKILVDDAEQRHEEFGQPISMKY